MPRFLVKNLGCKANLSDSLGLAAELRARGWSDAGSERAEALDLCIVNSCTVTDEADRQSRAMASRLARLHPDARVVVTGCAAEVDPERIAASRGIDYVIGTRDRGRLVDLVLERLGRPRSVSGEVLGTAVGYAEIASRHPLDREWPSPIEAGSMGSGVSHTRSFLKIQEGCNAFCTYCIIPYGRGPSRSLEPAAVSARIREICATGAREVVLTGTNIGDYGIDLGDGYSLEGLIRAILDETPLERLRLSSLDPVEITPGILELVEHEPRVCPHFHVSLQSPVDRVLKLMKRKYGSREARDCLEKISKLAPRPFVGMDLITGFPGESADDFAETVAFLDETPWARLHVFPFSEREGTPATRLPKSVPRAERSRRARILRELSLKRVRGHYEDRREKLTERVLPQVLFERSYETEGQEWLMGFSPEYLRVRVQAAAGEGWKLRNQVVPVQVGELRLDPASGEALFEGSCLS